MATVTQGTETKPVISAEAPSTPLVVGYVAASIAAIVATYKVAKALAKGKRRAR